MRELHGVIRLDWRQRICLKRYALLFDKLAIARQSEQKIGELFQSYSSEANAELTFLLDNGFLADVHDDVLRRAGDDRSRDALFQQLERNHLRLIEDEDVSGGLPSPANFREEYGVELIARQLARESDAAVVPLCFESPYWLNYRSNNASSNQSELVLQVVLEKLPTPGSQSAWQDILSFKNEERDKLWDLRRSFNTLSSKSQTESEIRDDFEWTIHQYCKAMDFHQLKASQSFVEVFIVSPLEIIENIIKLNWSKIAKGALLVKKRQVELMEAEMKAPGRECAYVFDARKRFGNPT